MTPSPAGTRASPAAPAISSSRTWAAPTGRSSTTSGWSRTRRIASSPVTGSKSVRIPPFSCARLQVAMLKRRLVHDRYLLALGQTLRGEQTYRVEAYLGGGAFAAGYRARDEA